MKKKKNIGPIVSPKEKIRFLAHQYNHLSKASLEKCKEPLSKVIHSIAYLAHLVVLPIVSIPGFSVENESQPQMAFPILGAFGRVFESLKIAEDVLFLASSARYVSANSLLRIMLESSVKSAVYFCLLTPKFRESATILRKFKLQQKSFVEIIEGILNTNPDIVDPLTLETHVSNTFSKSKYRLPLFSSMLKQLFQWRLFDYTLGEEKTEFVNFIYNECYGSLCGYIHSDPDSTYKKILLELDPNALAPFQPQLSPKYLKECLTNLMTVLDLVGLIYFASIKKYLSNPYTYLLIKGVVRKLESLGASLERTNKAIIDVNPLK